MFIKIAKYFKRKLFTTDYTIPNILFKVNEIKALKIIDEYLPNGFFFETSYSLSYQAIQHILNDIIIHRPKNIIEFGSGISTLVISNFIKKNNLNITFYSIDENSEYQKKLGLDSKVVTLIDSPIKKLNALSYKKQGSWYDLPSELINSDIKFDLIIIDGPKGNLSKLSRYGVLNFLEGRINEKSILFLDDTNRKDEQFLMKELSKKYRLNHCIQTLKYARLSFTNFINTEPS